MIKKDLLNQNKTKNKDKKDKKNFKKGSKEKKEWLSREILRELIPSENKEIGPEEATASLTQGNSENI